MRHKNIPEEKRASAKMEYDKKSHACMRASALPKKFGWGLYFDGKGKVDLVAVDSERYNQLVGTQGLKIVKAMKSKSRCPFPDYVVFKSETWYTLVEFKERRVTGCNQPDFESNL